MNSPQEQTRAIVCGDPVETPAGWFPPKCPALTCREVLGSLGPRGAPEGGRKTPSRALLALPWEIAS